MRPEDEDDIRRIFRATLCRGRAAPRDIGDLAPYERLSLDWYLHHGRVEVVVDDGRVGGYLLACLDEPRLRAWQRRQAARWTTRMLVEVLTGRRRGDARRFVTLRLRDGWTAWRHASRPPASAHAHVNLDPSLRAGRIGPQLATTMDALVRAAGLDAWYGELNLPANRRLARLERAGAPVVHRYRSATFSWLAGEPIDHVVLLRTVGVPRAEGTR